MCAVKGTGLKILITGGSGFIGGYFHRDLTALGHDLVNLDLIDPKGPQAEMAYVKGDIRDPKALDKAMEGVDMVVNLEIGRASCRERV